MEKTVKTLDEFGITAQLEVASAHRTPAATMN